MEMSRLRIRSARHKGNWDTILSTPLFQLLLSLIPAIPYSYPDRSGGIPWRCLDSAFAPLDIREIGIPYFLLHYSSFCCPLSRLFPTLIPTAVEGSLIDISAPLDIRESGITNGSIELSILRHLEKSPSG